MAGRGRREDGGFNFRIARRFPSFPPPSKNKRCSLRVAPRPTASPLDASKRGEGDGGDGGKRGGGVSEDVAEQP